MVETDVSRITRDVGGGGGRRRRRGVGGGGGGTGCVSKLDPATSSTALASSFDIPATIRHTSYPSTMFHKPFESSTWHIIYASCMPIMDNWCHPIYPQKATCGKHHCQPFFMV